MIIPPIFENIPDNRSLFDCVSIPNEVRVKATTTEVLGYMISESPHSESIPTFDYVYGLYNHNDIAIASNQSLIIKLSTEIFADSVQLSAIESDILNFTFNQMIKTTPSLPGRK